MNEHKIIKELTVVEHSPGGWKKKQKMFIVDGNEEKFAQYLGLDAEKYPLGTRFQVVKLEPEPPKERVVLPERMKWDKFAMLWTADGLLIAKAYIDRDGWYRIPFMHSSVSVEKHATLEATKQVIEDALAEKGYFGVRKVVDNE